MQDEMSDSEEGPVSASASAFLVSNFHLSHRENSDDSDSGSESPLDEGVEQVLAEMQKLKRESSGFEHESRKICHNISHSHARARRLQEEVRLAQGICDAANASEVRLRRFCVQLRGVNGADEQLRACVVALRAREDREAAWLSCAETAELRAR